MQEQDREVEREREGVGDTRGVCATSAAACHNLVGHRPTIYCFIKYPADDPHLINVNCTCHPLHFGPKIIICLSTSSWKFRLGHFNFFLFCFWPWWPSLFWLMGLFTLLAFTSVYVSLFTSLVVGIKISFRTGYPVARPAVSQGCMTHHAQFAN